MLIDQEVLDGGTLTNKIVKSSTQNETQEPGKYFDPHAAHVD